MLGVKHQPLAVHVAPQHPRLHHTTPPHEHRQGLLLPRLPEPAGAAASLGKVTVTGRGCDLPAAVCPGQLRQPFLPGCSASLPHPPFAGAARLSPQQLSGCATLPGPSGWAQAEPPARPACSGGREPLTAPGLLLPVLGESLVAAQRTPGKDESVLCTSVFGLLSNVSGWSGIRAIAPCMGSRKSCRGWESSQPGRSSSRGVLLLSPVTRSVVLRGHHHGSEGRWCACCK